VSPVLLKRRGLEVVVGASAAGQRPDAGQQLVAGQRLGQVVVGADHQPRDAVAGLGAIARHEHDPQRIGELLAQSAADLVARDVPKADLELRARRRDLDGQDHARAINAMLEATSGTCGLHKARLMGLV
jgi:hypothetical protein